MLGIRSVQRHIANISCGRRDSAFISPALVHFLFNNVLRYHAEGQRTRLFSCRSSLHVILLLHSATPGVFCRVAAVNVSHVADKRTSNLFPCHLFTIIIAFCLRIFVMRPKYFACLRLSQKW